VAEARAKDILRARGWTPVATLAHGRNGIDIMAERVLPGGRVARIIVEVKGNGSRTSALQRMGPQKYAEDVLRRLGGLPGLSPEAQAAAAALRDQIRRGEAIKGVVIRIDWRSGSVVETIKPWIAGVR
jgi:hypothetical protein